MRKASCSTCGSASPAAEMFALEGKPVCRSCADNQAREASSIGRSIDLGRIIDPTICGQCKTDYGSTELPLIGGSAFCADCSKHLYEQPYPAWLKLTMAGLLALLAVSLWRGTPYFKAGRHLVLAERAMDRKDYKTANKHFTEVLKVSPTAQKVVLLGAKASLLAGDVTQANKFFKLRPTFDNNELFNEVNQLATHAGTAYENAERAAKLANANKDEEAAELMHKASAEYPQSSELASLARTLDGSVAFDHKDYDGLLRITQASLKEAPNDPDAEGFLASALACKYAVTGDPEFRRQAEEALEKARLFAQRSPQDMAAFQEYSERIRYRLESRVIIDKTEYDRRFRQKEARR